MIFVVVFVLHRGPVVLTDVDRDCVFLVEAFVQCAEVPITLEELTAWSIHKSQPHCLFRTLQYAPERRVCILLYSSLSLGDRPFSFSSSSRARFAAISLSNLIFHTLKDSTVTGVPRVLASSA